MRRKKIHPAWKVLVCCCLIQAGTLGAALCASMFYTPVSQSLEIPLGTFTMYVTVQGILSVAASPVYGNLIQKISGKTLMTIAVVLYGVSWIVPALSQGMALWYLIGVMRGVSIPMFFLFIPIVIQNWFEEKRGMALGIATACTGFSGAVINYGISWLMDFAGWRLASIFCGIFCLLASLFALLFGVTMEPEKKGLLPYGSKSHAAEMISSKCTLTAKEILHSRPFWLMAIMMGTFGVGSVISQYMASYALHLGGTLQMAGACATAALLGNSIGKILLGFLNDRLGIKKGNGILMILAAASFVLFLSGSRWIVLLCTASFAVGFYNSMISVSAPTLTRMCFWGENYSKIYSWLMACQSLANAVSVSLLGRTVDYFESYRPVFFVGFVGGMLCLFTYYLLFKEENYGTVTSKDRERSGRRIAGRQSDGQSV